MEVYSNTFIDLPFPFLRPVVDNGYVYLAQPPLPRYKKGKKEIYLKDDNEMNTFFN